VLVVGGDPQRFCHGTLSFSGLCSAVSIVNLT